MTEPSDETRRLVWDELVDSYRMCFRVVRESA